MNAFSFLLPVLGPDGTLYALLAKNIYVNKDAVNLTLYGNDWLDKPHLPFWISAASYAVFGINSFAYKFPAFLCWLAGAWYTYRFCRIFYPRQTAQLAVLIYISAAHVVISNNDVRAEPYLTLFIIAATFHFYIASGRRLLHLVLGAVFTAAAMMTKGPFVIVPIGSGLCMHWIIKKNWNAIFHPRWILAAILTLVFILPELICLYLQFDAHPEKVVFGRTQVSGLRFFFWDSQFGRFTNTGPIKGSGDPFFYFHTLLWAFLPWSLILYAAIINGIRKWKTPQIEYISIGSFVFCFLLFSLSSFQLPHYLNIVYPFASIYCAAYLQQINPKTQSIISIIQVVISAILLLSPALISYFVHPRYYVLIIGLSVAAAAFAILWRRRKAPGYFIAVSFCAAMFVYAFLFYSVYPTIFPYQAGTEAARALNKMKIDGRVGFYKEDSYAFAFYSKVPVLPLTLKDIQQQTSSAPLILYMSKDNVDSLHANGLSVSVLQTFPDFHISQLTGNFLYYQTREAACTQVVLARVTKSPVSVPR